MNFEQLYQKVQNGTASEEEKAFVENKIRQISSILDEPPQNGIEIEPAQAEVVKAARKRYNYQATIRTVLIVLCVLVLIAGGVCGYVFGKAIPAAKSSAVIAEDAAVELAREFIIKEKLNGEAPAELRIEDVDRELDVHNGLSKASFYYEIELEFADVEYKVRVNADDGYTSLLGVHYD